MRFGELKTPVSGWLVLDRPPARSTRLALSGESGFRGVASDPTLLRCARAACGSLTVLDVRGCEELSVEALLDVVRANPRLRVLRAQKAKAWGGGAVTQLLAAAPQLLFAELDLGCRRLEESMLVLLVEPALRPRQLTVLNRMPPLFCKEQLAPMLARSALRRLVLRGCRVGVPGAKGLALALSPMRVPDAMPAPPPQLRHLDVSKCRLGAEGATVLAEMLLKNSTLRGLDVSANAMGDEGVIAICHSLRRSKKGNTTLKELRLHGNLIHFEGGQAVAEMLADNMDMEVLSLGDCYMGAAAGRLVSDAMRKNRFLQQLELQGNRLGDAVGKAFVETLLQGRTRLWRLELHNNELQPTTAHALSQLALKSLLQAHSGFSWERCEAFSESDEGESEPPSDASESESEGVSESEEGGSEVGSFARR